MSGTIKSKKTNGSILFPEIQKELIRSPSIIGNFRAYISVVIHTDTDSTSDRESWYLLFQGQDVKPVISMSEIKKVSNTIPKIIVELHDKDIVNFITGGTSGLRGMASGKLKITGDLVIANELAKIFVKAGGVERVMQYLKKHQMKLPKRENITEKEIQKNHGELKAQGDQRFNIKSKL